MSDNPLANFYRNKEIYVKLPTQGKWYSQPPKLTAQGEIGIYPMTVKDEILMNIPDSLYNGESLFELFQSIAPDIADPYEIAMPDVDVILLASRSASYNNTMRVSTKCPHCEALQDYEIDLPTALSNIKINNQSQELEIDGLLISLKPNTLKTVTANRIKTVEVSRMISNMDITGVIPDDQKDAYNNSIQISAAAQIAIITDSIESITLPDGSVVTEFSHIAEWISNSNKRTVDAITESAALMNQNGIENEFNFVCSEEECGKEFKAPIEFNPAFFFNNNYPKQDQPKT